MKNNNEADYIAYCAEKTKEVQDCLKLFKEISGTSHEKAGRDRILEYCRKYSCLEESIWYYLACYQEGEEFTPVDRPGLLFQTDDQLLREKILTLIPQLPQDGLSELKKLLNLIGNFLDRITYLCDQTISSFLETSKGMSSPFPSHLSVYSADQLVQKLGDEFDALCNSVMINTIEVIDNSYEEWLQEKALQVDLPSSPKF